jgi:hypothetical protein
MKPKGLQEDMWFTSCTIGTDSSFISTPSNILPLQSVVLPDGHVA